MRYVVRMVRNLCACILVTSLVACPGGDDPEPATTTDTPPTVPTQPDPTTGDGSSSTSTSSSGDTSTGVPPSTEADLTTGSGTCVYEGDPPCREYALLPDFCTAIDALATDVGIPVSYVQILVDSCEAKEGKCSICFNLSNLCAQVGEDCGELLYEKCLCVGFAFDAP